MVALDARRINQHIITFAKENHVYCIYVDNIRIYYSVVKDHAYSFYKKVLEFNGEKL